VKKLRRVWRNVRALWVHCPSLRLPMVVCVLAWVALIVLGARLGVDFVKMWVACPDLHVQMTFGAIALVTFEVWFFRWALRKEK
jgi:hypothetical protein